MSDQVERYAGRKGKSESPRARRAFEDYLRMAPGRTQARSLRNLLAAYKQDPLAPTKSWTTLSNWSAEYEWVQRAAQFDREQAARLSAEYEERRKAIMEVGLAQVHERVGKLVEIFDRLYADFADNNKVWLRELKGIGSYENFQVVEVVRFNAGLVGELRATLDDIAAEVGGRPRKTELTGKGGGPIRSSTVPFDTSKLNDEELAMLEEILESASGDDEPAEPGRSAG